MNNNNARDIHFSIFSFKDKITQNDGTEFLDFHSCNYEIDYNSKNFVLSQIFILKEEHLCRLDLVCQEVYNDPKFVNALCKWNDITNPFSLNVGDIIVCPTTETLNSFYVKNPVTSVNALETKSTWLDPSRATKKDINRLDQMKKAAYKEKNGSTDPKPTNLLREGEVPFIADGKRITFAPYTSPNK